MENNLLQGLREIYLASPLSADDIAEIAGFKQASSVRRILGPKAANSPSIDNYNRIAGALGYKLHLVPLDYVSEPLDDLMED